MNPRKILENYGYQRTVEMERENEGTFSVKVQFGGCRFCFALLGADDD